MTHSTAAFLGGYYNSQSDTPSWRWLNQDEIPSIGADPSVGYENWKEQNTGDQDRCILSALVNPDQSGNTPNGTFENDYGWYTVDCNIKQFVVCKDCAYGYYFLNGCYRSCNVEDAPYDFWEITCADDVDEWNCKFGLADENDLFGSLYEQDDFADEDLYDNGMSSNEVGSGTGSFHNCMRFGQDWDVTRNGTLNFSNRNITYVSKYSFAGVDNSAPKYLKLSNNKIGQENDDKKLPAGIFNELTKLQEIWLDHNSLEILNTVEFT